MNNHQASLSILLFSVFLIGACLGVLAQLIRQLPDPLTTLGASTGPWLMSGFFLVAIASKRVKKNWKATQKKIRYLRFKKIHPLYIPIKTE